MAASIAPQPRRGKPCEVCSTERAVVQRPNGSKLCRGCFFLAFELEVHNTIVKHNVFQRGEIVAIGASGGKDSTVLAYVLALLNERYDYGLQLRLLSVDEGIAGYRDDSLDTVKQNSKDYNLPLRIVSYEQLYSGWSMDKIVGQTGGRNSCSYCGIFRRQVSARALSDMRHWTR